MKEHCKVFSICFSVFFLKESQPREILLFPYQPSRSVKLGDRVTLNCNSRSSRGATYEWYQNELNIALMNDPRMIRENNTLKILKTKLYHTGVYQCIETRKGREIQKQNRYVLLNVEGKTNDLVSHAALSSFNSDITFTCFLVVCDRLI